VAETAAAEKTGRDLLAHLKATGTGTARVEALEAFLKASPKAGAAEAVEHMRACPNDFPLGTVRKAGKFAYGDGWDCLPDNMTPSDEAVALREQNAELSRQLRGKEAENARLLRDNQELRKEVNHYKDREKASAQRAPAAR
jgi:hypothetical protein